MPSTAARARWAGVVLRQGEPVQGAGRVRPVRGALALEVGHQDQAVGAGRGAQRQPGQARRGRRRACAAAASSTRAALSVQTSGRNAPVASANPATMPVASAVGAAEIAETTPEVPIETATSPGRMPKPSAAAALSPAPGPRMDAANSPTPWPATSDGRQHAGQVDVGAAERQFQQVGPVGTPPPATSSRCRWRPTGRWSRR